jgi:peroxiredoxin
MSKSLTTSLFILALLLTPRLFAQSVGEKAPDFSAFTLNNQLVWLSKDYIGKKPVMLVFWATWCSNCSKEIPKLKELIAHFGNRFPLFAINIGIEDSIEKTQAYIKKQAINYPVIFDETSAIASAYRIWGTPTLVIVGANGEILYRAAHTPTIQEINQHWRELTAQ